MTYAFPVKDVETPQCFHCGKTGTVTVSAEAYASWREGLGPIQQFMGEMPMELREQLISGTHPECWMELFGTDEDEND
jgi:hypothetical protein